jgi:hypothetical protein
VDEHDDLFYRGSVLKNLVPVEVVIKTGSLSTLSLSQTGHLDPTRTTTHLVSLALIISHLENKNEEEERDPSNKSAKNTNKTLSQVTQ